MEIWWDIPIKTVVKVENNRPDIVIWNTEQKYCQIVEITVPLDTNLETAYKTKELKYVSLMSNMQQLYRGYKFSIIVITVGVMGAVPKSLEKYLRKLDLKADHDKIKVIIERMQRAALIGTMKICKTVLNM